MSWRGGRGGGGGRFDRGGRSDRGGRRGGFGRFGGRGRGDFPTGPPDEVVEAGTFKHVCEGEAVCKLTNEKIPYFNASIYLENKTSVGKVDEIFGGVNSPFFTIKCQEGVVASSFPPEKKFYIDPAKLLPLERFLPKPKGTPAARGGRGRGRGGRGGGRGLGVRGGGRFGGGRFGSGGSRGGFRGGRGGRTPSFGRGRGRS